MKYIGAIDQGTTSTRFVVFNRNGENINNIVPQYLNYDLIMVKSYLKKCLKIVKK